MTKTRVFCLFWLLLPGIIKVRQMVFCNCNDFYVCHTEERGISKFSAKATLTNLKSRIYFLCAGVCFVALAREGEEYRTEEQGILNEEVNTYRSEEKEIASLHPQQKAKHLYKT